ncbi:hypothetical protein [Streptomyces cadmiisoli]|uniref:hypothetical protein n=1 Tax=Streptomyces cadmiisoli TaxID=2184053 RepID=UPI003665F65F
MPRIAIVLRDRMPDAGKKPLHQLIRQGAADVVLTARQAVYLDYGRQIRNRMAHGQVSTIRGQVPGLCGLLKTVRWPQAIA